MGGVDKGLQILDGEPLVQHALRRLEPQVAALMISANRNLDRYAAFGVPVWADADQEFAGPLAGFLSGMAHCTTEWMVTVPCDTPRFPTDLVARLASGTLDARAAMAVTEEEGTRRRQPVFCLVRAGSRDALAAYIADGGRTIERWLQSQGCADVMFEDSGAFFNANTLDELRRLGDA
jgi:molybdopterin-guanine dinucleotide biosynthesis protein A